MTENSSSITDILFIVLAIGTLILPRKWAIFCWLLTAHLDLSGFQWLSASAVGWENMIRIIILPSILLIRLNILSSFSNFSVSGSLWLLLGFYAGIASLWSPFSLSAIKQLGYLYAYSIGFLMVFLAWKTKLIDAKVISLYVYVVFAMAVVQSFILGNEFGASINDYSRFTTFTSRQSFAESLVALLVLVLFLPDIKTFHKLLMSGILLGQILLNGSRISLVGAVCVLAVASFLLLRPTAAHRLVTVYGIAAVSGLLVVLLYAYSPQMLENVQLRAWDLIDVFSNSTELADIGTFRFRTDMWNTTLHSIQYFTPAEMILGRGTSSGAEVALRSSYLRYSAESVDANRIIHNEILRALYEWGIVGLGIFVAFLLSIVITSFSLIMRSNVGGFALLCFIPMLFITLLFENIMAAGGSAGGVGFVLVIGYALGNEPTFQRAYG